MRVLTFSGTPEAIGRAFGETCRTEIAALYAARVENAITQVKAYGDRDVSEADLLKVAERALPMVQTYHPAGYAELQGIAAGAGRTLAEIWAMNSLTDLRDVLAFGDVESEGCTSFVVRGERSFLGQTWDLATDNMPHVLILRREVDGAPNTACLTLVGCLSLIGMNDAGLAIGTTNIRTHDSRVGVGYLDIIHKYLFQRDFEAGVRAVLDAPRAGAHYYYAMDAQMRGAALECTALDAERTDVQGSFVHTNHILTERFTRIEASTPMASSAHRQQRMETMLASSPNGEEDLMQHLADHEGGETAICRHDYNGISSNGSIVMEPAHRRIWAVHGPACQGTWQSFSVP